MITVESERPTEEVRGHKGELRSLSSLAKLVKDPQPSPTGGAAPAGEPTSSPAPSEPKPIPPSQEVAPAGEPTSAPAPSEPKPIPPSQEVAPAAEPAPPEPSLETPPAPASPPPVDAERGSAEKPQLEEEKPVPDTADAGGQKETTEGHADEPTQG